MTKDFAKALAQAKQSTSSDTPPADKFVKKALFSARAWSPEIFHALPPEMQKSSCIWLTTKAATPETLLELFSLGLPVALIIKQSPASVRWAQRLSYQYTNIVRVITEPLQEEDCTKLLEKMRNVLMRRRLDEFLEQHIIATQFATQQVTTQGIYTDSSDHAERSQPVPPYLSARSNDTMREEKQTFPILPEAITLADAQMQYTAIFDSANGKYFLPNTLRTVIAQVQALVPRSATPPLVRVHDKYAVNPAFVQDVRRSESKRDYLLTLKNGREIKMSRTYKDALQYFSVKLPRTHSKRKQSSDKHRNRARGGGGGGGESHNNSTQQS